MAENDPIDIHIFKHFCRNFSSEGSAFTLPAILGCYFVRAANVAVDVVQMDESGGDDNVNMRRDAAWEKIK